MLPSDIARLVLAYLHDEGLATTYHAFLTESPHLDELRRNPFASILRPSTKTLVATLEEYEDIKDTEKGKNASDKVLTGLWRKFDSVTGQIKYKYQPSENSAEAQCKRSKENLLILRTQQLSDLQTKGNIIGQPKIQGSLVIPNPSSSTVIIPVTTTSSLTMVTNQRAAHAVVTPMGIPVARVQLPLTATHINSSPVTQSMGIPVTTMQLPLTASQVMTSSVTQSMGIPVTRVQLPLTASHVMTSQVTQSMAQTNTMMMTTSTVQGRPVIGSRNQHGSINFGDNEDSLDGSSIVSRWRRDSGSSMNSASDIADFRNLSPYKSRSGVFKSPKRKSAAPKRKPGRNLDHQKKPDTPPAPGEEGLDELLKDIPVVLEELLNNRELQKKLAGNINRSLPTVSQKQELGVPASPQDPSVGQSLSIDDILNTQMSEDTVTEIIDNTSSDPAFEALFSLFNVDKEQYAEEQRAEIAERNRQNEAASSNVTNYFTEPMDTNNIHSTPRQPSSSDFSDRTKTTPPSIQSMAIYGISPSSTFDSKQSKMVAQSQSTPISISTVLNINEDSQMEMEPVVLPSLDGSDPQIMSPVAVTKESPIFKQQASPVPKQQQAGVASSSVFSSAAQSNDSQSQSSLSFMSRSMVPPKKRQRQITLEMENPSTSGTEAKSSPNVKAFSFATHLGLNQNDGKSKAAGVVAPVFGTEIIKKSVENLPSPKQSSASEGQLSKGCSINDINEIINQAKRDLFTQKKFSEGRSRSSPSKEQKAASSRKSSVQTHRTSKRKTRAPERFSPCTPSKSRQRVVSPEKQLSSENSKKDQSEDVAQNVTQESSNSSNFSKPKEGRSLRSKTPKKAPQGSSIHHESPVKSYLGSPNKDKTRTSNLTPSKHSNQLNTDDNSKPLLVDTSEAQSAVHDAKSFMAALHMSPTGSAPLDEENEMDTISASPQLPSSSTVTQSGTKPQLQSENISQSNVLSAETSDTQSTSIPRDSPRTKLNLIVHRSPQASRGSPMKTLHISPRKCSSLERKTSFERLDNLDNVDLDSEPNTPQMQIVSQPNTPQAVLSPNHSQPMTPQFVQTAEVVPNELEHSMTDENSADTVVTIDSQVSFVDLVSSEAEQSLDGNMSASRTETDPCFPSQVVETVEVMTDIREGTVDNESVEEDAVAIEFVVEETVETVVKISSGVLIEKQESSASQTVLQVAKETEIVSGEVEQSIEIHDDKDVPHSPDVTSKSDLIAVESEQTIVCDTNESVLKTKTCETKSAMLKTNLDDEPMDESESECEDSLPSSVAAHHQGASSVIEIGFADPESRPLHEHDHVTPKKQIQREEVTPAKEVLSEEVTPTKHVTRQHITPAKPVQSKPFTPANEISSEEVTLTKHVTRQQGTPAKPAQSKPVSPSKQIQTGPASSIKHGGSRQIIPEKQTVKRARRIQTKKVASAKPVSNEQVTPIKPKLVESEQVTNAKQVQSKKAILKKQERSEPATTAKQDHQTELVSPEKQAQSKKAILTRQERSQPATSAKQAQTEQVSPKKQARSKKVTPAKQVAREEATPTKEVQSKQVSPEKLSQNDKNTRELNQSEQFHKNQDETQNSQKLESNTCKNDQASLHEDIPDTLVDKSTFSSPKGDKFVTVPCNIIGSDTAILQAPIPVPQVKTPGKDQRIRMSEDVENTIKPMQALCKVISAGQVADVTVSSSNLSMTQSPMQTIDPKAIGMALGQTQIVATPVARKVRTILPKPGELHDSVSVAMLASGISKPLGSSTPATSRTASVTKSEVKPRSIQPSKATETPARVTPEGNVQGQTVRPTSISGKRSGGSGSKSANTRPPLRRMPSSSRGLVVRTLDVAGNVKETTPKVHAPPRGKGSSRGKYVVRNLDCHEGGEDELSVSIVRNLDCHEESDDELSASEHSSGEKLTPASSGEKKTPTTSTIKSPDFLFDQPGTSKIKSLGSKSPRKPRSLLLNKSSSAMVSPEANVDKAKFVTPKKKTPRKQDLRAVAAMDFNEATVDMAAEVLASCSPRKTPIKQRTPGSGDLNETSRLAETLMRLSSSPTSRFTAIQSASILRNVGNSQRRNLMAEQEVARTKHNSGNSESSPRKRGKGRPRLRDLAQSRSANSSRHGELPNGVAESSTAHVNDTERTLRPTRESRVPTVNGDVRQPRNEDKSLDTVTSTSQQRTTRSAVNTKQEKQGKGRKRLREKAPVEQPEVKKAKKSKRKRKSFPTNMDVDKFLSQLHYPQ